MKAGVLERVAQLVVKDVPDPNLEKGTMIIEVKVCSVCGTDIRTYHYGHPNVLLPHILGHEIAGEVVSIAGDINGYQVGQRVQVAPRIACGTCFYCRKGQDIYCQNRTTIGFQLPGGFAEYLLVPSHGLKCGIVNEIADTLSFEEASLAEPLSCCLRAQRACNITPDGTVVVIGGGPIGIMHCRLARINNANKIILIEQETERLQQINLDAVDIVVDSRKSNPEAEIASLTEDRGADVVIVACSPIDAQLQAFSVIGKGGRINFFAGLAQGSRDLSINSNLIHYNEISVIGTHSSTPQDNRDALALLATKALDVSDLMTHTFPLDSIEEAFRYREKRQGMCVGVFP